MSDFVISMFTCKEAKSHQERIDVLLNVNRSNIEPKVTTRCSTLSIKKPRIYEATKIKNREKIALLPTKYPWLFCSRTNF